MGNWSQLRYILALLCAIAVLASALAPASGVMLLAVIVPVASTAAPLPALAERIGAHLSASSIQRSLVVVVGRAPPVF